MNTPMRLLLISLTLTFVTSCSGGGGDDSPAPAPALSEVQVSWNPNPEITVNRNGGGYKVYYSTISGFAPGDTGVTEIDVPYSSGSTAPTSTQIQLLPGTYFIRIIAYSALNAPGTSGGSTSTATPQTTMIVS